MFKSIYKLYVYYKYIFLGIILWKLQKMVIHEFLKRKKIKHTIPPRQHLVKENFQIQSDFYNLFKNYDLCSKCINHCCGGKFNRFSTFDYYLQNRLCLSESTFSYREFYVLFKKIYKKFFKKIIQYSNSHDNTKAPYEVCIHLGPDGCKLPIGNRPMICIEGVCRRFINAFTYNELKKYSKLNNKYFYLKCKCIFYIMKDSIFSM